MVGGPAPLSMMRDSFLSHLLAMSVQRAAFDHANKALDRLVISSCSRVGLGLVSSLLGLHLGHAVAPSGREQTARVA